MSEPTVLHPEIQRLTDENARRREQLTSLLTEADALIHTVKPNLLAWYQTRIGVWELEALQAQGAVATRQLTADDGELDWARLRELCGDVVALRRGDHSAARLRIEQARLAGEKAETEEEAVAHFQRWAKNPAVRKAICGECLSPEEKRQKIWQVFGLAAVQPAETAPPGTPDTNDV